MFGQRRSIALTAVTVVVAILLSGALAIAAAPECALLNDSEVMALISGAGETALMIKCDEIAPAEIPSTPPEPTEVLSALGVEIMVNDRTLDAGKANRTQSETSVAVSGNTVLVGFNDSGQFTGANATGDPRKAGQ